MRDVLSAGTTLGYCTNVHAGATLADVRANLERYAVPVRALAHPTGTLGIGLWLAAPAARELRAPGETRRFADWLAARDLGVFTINGFPQENFHQPIVKHRVYEPNWTRPERLAYTIDLMHVIAELVPPGGEASISTLPVGWAEAVRDDEELAAAAENLRRAAHTAAELSARSDRLIHLDLEPEPGCVLETSADVVRFFADHLIRGPEPGVLLQHLRVCHDVCHAAVMFEDQAEAFRRYDTHQILVGKVQLSAAIRIAIGTLPEVERVAALAELRAFDERRYLHQTTWLADGTLAFEDDLADIVADPPPDAWRAPEWRVHYHVPVFLERFGSIATTRDEIVTCLRLLESRNLVRHFEVETYAWDVLPEALRPADLASGIAQELAWVTSEAKTSATR